MTEYTTPCDRCAEVRKHIDAVDFDKLGKGALIAGTVRSFAKDDPDCQYVVHELTVKCDRCESTGRVLTAEGQKLAILVGALLKGTVIV